MKRKVLTLFVLIIMMITVTVCFLGCGDIGILPSVPDSGITDNDNTDNDDSNNDNPNTDNPNTDNPNTDNPNTDNPNTDNPNTDNPNTDNPNTDNQDKIYTITFNAAGGTLVGNKTIRVVNGKADGDIPSATKNNSTFIGWSFTKGGAVAFTQENGSTYKFTSTRTVYAVYTENGTGGDDDNNNNNDNNNNGETTNNKPQSTKTTVYYTNSDNWAKVYAYMWNYGTQKPAAEWPGKLLTSFGTSGFGEKQYKIDVDYSQYDRIIFNNGSGKQTKDLVIGAATSGYYGENGIFTMGTEDYGKVIYTTLSDNTNLSYLPAKSKKISVYTPPGYSKSKKYGVLYMFDGQNLYAAASGSDAEKNGSSERWAVDVAVTNLVKNGCDGVIVVGIDDASSYRDQELTMSLSFGTLTSLGDPQYGSFRNGKLDELGNFIKQTVMPWVKKNYSVDDSREKTGIAGSSSGGLAAYYLGLRDNDKYGYIGAFSPANGLFQSSDWTKFYKSKDFGKGKPNVYVYCGQNDNDLEDMLLPETKKAKSGLKPYGIDVIENYVDGGTHNEVYWRIAFADFLGKLAQ